MHIKRENCRLCHSKELVCVLPLEPILLGEHYSNSPSKKDEIRFPIDIYQCKQCKAVQTIDDIDPSYLWKDYTYFSGQTNGIINHFEDFTLNILKEFFSDKKLNVLDIGSNDGTLLKQFKKRGHNVQGFDPASTVAEIAREEGIPTIISLFNIYSAKEHLGDKKYDLITAFNVFAHSEKMDSMIKGVENHLKEDGIFCFEVQSLKEISRKKILGTFFHEHMIHYSVLAAKNFLERNNFKIIDFWENNIQNGSIIFITNKKNSTNFPIQKNKISSEIDNEQILGLHNDKWARNLKDYINKSKIKIEKILKILKKKGIAKISGYGAARSGPTLAIQFGLDNKLSKLYDDHKSKKGKYAPFNNLYVDKTENLNYKSSKYTVILAYIHYKGIIKKHIDYLNSGGNFILLWPEVIVVNKENYHEIIK